jgi:hypothetical protein
MGFATSGYPSKDPRALEGRVSTLERLLGSVRLIRIQTENEGLMVLGYENGPGKAGLEAPLNLTIVQGTEADKFQIVSGFVNTQIPTLSAVALDNDPPPEITVSADVWVYAKVVGTFGSPDTYVVTIHTASTSTPPAEAVSATAFTSYYPIGYVDFTSGSPATYEISNYHTGGNLGVESFGAVNLWWKK